MRITIYLLLIALLASSCAGKLKKSNVEEISKLTFDSIVVEEKIRMQSIPEEPDYIPYATFKVKFVFPNTFGTEEQLQKLQAIFYEIVLGEKYADATSPQEAMERYKDNFPKWAQSFGIPIHYYDSELENRIDFSNENVISICVFSRNEESDQPRASSGKGNYCIDLHTLKLLTLDDLLIGDYKMDLIEVIKKNTIIMIKEDFHVDDVEEFMNGAWDDCEVCELDDAFDNFALNKTGITFTYHDHSTHFIRGGYDVHIPYGEIADLLNPDMFAKLFPYIDLQKEKEAFQLQEIDNSKTVVDMFLLLPDEAFDGAYSSAIRKRMANGEHIKFESAWENDYRWIDISDIEKGVLTLEDESESPLGFIYFWRLRENKNLVTVLNNHSYKLKAYWYKNGKLEKDDDFYAFVNENSNLETDDFFDLQNVPEEIRKDLQYSTDSYLSLSKDGVITFTISNAHFYDYNNREIFDEREYYYKFELVNGKWTKKRIKTYNTND